MTVFYISFVAMFVGILWPRGGCLSACLAIGGLIGCFVSIFFQ